MHLIRKGLLVLILLTLFSGTTAAFTIEQTTDMANQRQPIQQEASDSAAVRVIPNEGIAGDSHTVLVTGLNPDERITVDIIYDETDDLVYSRDFAADVRGRVEVNIFTERGDPSGQYTIQVLNTDNDVIGSANLTILEPVGLEGTLTVSPDEQTAGTRFVFTIEDVQPFADLEIEVRNENEEIAFTTRVRATVDGTAVVNFASRADDDPGEYSVRVLFEDTVEVASGTFTVLEQIFDAVATVEPGEALPGETVFVTISGLEAESAATVALRRDGTVIETRDITTNISGIAIFALDIAEDSALGHYDVLVTQENERVARGTFSVYVPELSVGVTPEVTIPDQPFAIDISGLLPGETVEVQLIETGNVTESISATGDENGEAQVALAVDTTLEIGTYGVRVVRRDSVAYSQVVRVEASAAPETAFDPDDVSLQVDPESGPAPTQYIFTATGLPVDADVTFNIVFEGTVVLSVDSTSDENGIAITGATSELTDPPGDYVLELVYEDEVIAEFTFQITDDIVEEDGDETPETDASPADDNLIVDPAIVAAGESISIIATDLPAGETVVVDVLYDGASVFSVERTVDANGNVTVGLVADEDDDLGLYTVQITTADGEIIAASEFEITDAESAQTARATLTIEPESGELGTDHTITVIGLDADETVTLDVTFDDETVFSTERQADASGTLTVVLTTEETDAEGEYTVTVTRASGGTLAAAFVAGDDAPPDTAQPAETDDAQITIEPPSGEIGTDHTITVTGLQANEMFTLDVSYDGESVFLTDRQADVNGRFVIVLTTEEGDPEGEYTVTILRTDGSSLSDVLIAGDGTPDTAASNAAIVIEPNVVGTEEPFDVLISGLNDGETVTIEVSYDGAVVFETERSADSDGEITLNLRTDPDDATGEYTVIVRRADDSTLAAGFELATDDASAATADESDVVLTVEPDSGEIGTDYTFTVSGLDANESVELVVSLGDETVFSTTREADGAGELSITLTSEEGDEAGVYTFTVLRGDAELAAADFVVEGDTAETPPDEEAQPDEETPRPDVPVDVLVLGVDNDILTGRLTSGEPSISYTFFGEAGQSALINLRSAQFDPYLSLLDNAGAVLASNDDAGGTLDSRIGPYELPYTGEYTVVVTSYGAELGTMPEFGRYDLQLEAVEIETLLIELSDGTQADRNSLEDTRPEVSYTFTGEAGETVLMTLRSSQFDAFLILRDENGAELIRNDDGSADLDAEIGPYQLPYTGEYTVIVTSYDFVTFSETVSGDYEFVLDRVTLIETEYDNMLALDIEAEGGTQVIEFVGSSGDVISVTVDSADSVDTVASLIGPDGAELARDDDGGSGFDPEINGYVLPDTGVYTLLLQPFTPGDTGSLDLIITLDDVRTLDEGARTVRLNRKQTSDVLILSGEAGDAISMTVTLQSGDVGALSISAQQGVESLMTYQTFGMPQSITLGFVVPEDGTVRIDIADSEGGNAIYEVAIERE